MTHPSLLRAVVTAVLATTDDTTRCDFASRCKITRMAAEDDIAKRIIAALERLVRDH